MAEAARLVPRDAKVIAPPSASGVLERCVQQQQQRTRKGEREGGSSLL